MRENGRASVSLSTMYWRSSGRMNSKKKRRFPRDAMRARIAGSAARASRSIMFV
jgi:hypothetical protein